MRMPSKNRQGSSTSPARPGVIIGKTDTGKILYFETEDSFARYAARD